MNDMRLGVTLYAVTAQFERGIAKAQQSVKGFNSDVAKSAQQNKEAWQTVGVAAAAFGATVSAAYVQAARSAIDFESGMADIAKTVDESAATIDALGLSLRQMATRDVPMQVRGLTDIAAAAGQLGIQTENILGFTRVMADLGVATNMGSEEAATSLARLANITQMAQTDFDRLGSVVVDLGNNLATTEAEIVGMGLRIAGAGSQIGLTEAQTLGLAGALSSLGVAADAGGTAISRVMIDIATAVATGSAELDQFAEIAGMSSEAFTAAWENDAGSALATFIEGLGNVAASGENVFGVLEDIGMADIRVRDSLLRTSGAGDILRRSLDLGTQAWEENTALTQEAALRYETTESRIQFAKNSLSDLAIEVGQHLLPALGGMIDSVGGAADALIGLPEPVQKIAIGLGALTGGLGLAGGAFLLAVPRIMATKNALDTLAKTSPRVVAALRGVTGFLMGPWGLALAAAAVAVGWLALEHQRGRQAVEEYTGAIEADSGAIGANTRAHVVNKLEKEGLLKQADLLGISLSDLTDAILGEGDAYDEIMPQLEARINNLQASEGHTGRHRDAALALRGALLDETEALRGGTEEHERRTRALDGTTGATHKQVQAMLAASDGAGTYYTRLRPAVDWTGKLTDASHASMGAAIAAAGAMDIAGLSAEELAEQSEAAAKRLDDLRAAADAMVDPITAMDEAMRLNEEAMRARAEAEAEAAKKGKGAWEEYATEVTTSLADVNEQLRLQVEAQEQWGDNLAAVAARVPAEFLPELEKIATESPELLALMRDASDEELLEMVRLTGMRGDEQVNAYRNAIAIMPDIAAEFGEETANALLDKLADGVLEASQIAAAYTRALATGVDPLLIALGMQGVKIAGVTGLGGFTRNEGGVIPGGGPDRDSVWIYGTPGEWVINRGASQHYGDDAMKAVNEKRAVIQPLNTGGRVTGNIAGLNPEFLRRLSLWSGALGQSYNVGSGYRSLAQQAVLYDRWVRRVPGQAPAAPPGRSNHNFGLASDGPRWGGRNPGAFGLRYPMSYEPWHVEPNEARAMRGGGGGQGLDFFSVPPVPEHKFPIEMSIGGPLTASMTHAHDAVRDYITSQFQFGDLSSPASGLPDAGAKGGTPAKNQALVEPMNAARFGASQWPAHRRLVQKESSWNHLAQNPRSTAFGLYQFLNSTWATVGGRKTRDPAEQARLGIAYIAQRYGSPAAALAFHGRNNWYNAGGRIGSPWNPHVRDQGGPLMPGFTFNGTGAPETVIPGAAPGAHGAGVQTMNLIDAVGHLQGKIDELTAGMTNAELAVALTSGELATWINRLDHIEGALDHAADATMTLVRAALAAGEPIDSIGAGLDALAALTRSASESAGFDPGISAMTGIDSGIVAALGGHLTAGNAGPEVIQDTIDQIRHLVDGWEEAARAAEVAARRAELWGDIGLAEIARDEAVAALEAAEGEEARATALEDVAAAQERLSAAVQATQAFDVGEAARLETEAIAAELGRLEAELAVAEQIQRNMAAHAFEQMSPEEQIEAINAEMAKLVPWTDDWVRLMEQAEGIQAEITDGIEEAAQAAADAADEVRRLADEAARAADESARAAQQLADGLEADLNRLLDRKAQIDQQAAQATASYAQAVARAQAQASKQINDMIRARQDALFGFADVSQRFESVWGNTARAITGNIQDQMAIVAEAMAGVDQLRSRGVSESVISELGLDDPRKIGQVRLLLRATDQELRDLSTVMESRVAQAADRAGHEASLLLGALGRSIVEVQTDLQITMQELRDQLNEKLAELAVEAASLGHETGRGYAELMQAALDSGLDGIIATAKKYQDALRDAKAARAEADALAGQIAPNPGTVGGGATHVAPGNQVSWNPSRVSNAQSAAMRLFDTGIEAGVWRSGEIGMNASGQDEYVLRLDQLRALATGGGRQAAPQITIFLDDRKMKDLVKVTVNGEIVSDERVKIMEGRS